MKHSRGCLRTGCEGSMESREGEVMDGRGKPMRRFMK
jgi:hypothetical protein